MCVSSYGGLGSSSQLGRGGAVPSRESCLLVFSGRMFNKFLSKCLILTAFRAGICRCGSVILTHSLWNSALLWIVEILVFGDLIKEVVDGRPTVEVLEVLCCFWKALHMLFFCSKLWRRLSKWWGMHLCQRRCEVPLCFWLDRIKVPRRWVSGLMKKVILMKNITAVTKKLIILANNYGNVIALLQT